MSRIAAGGIGATYPLVRTSKHALPGAEAGTHRPKPNSGANDATPPPAPPPRRRRAVRVRARPRRRAVRLRGLRPRQRPAGPDQPGRHGELDALPGERRALRAGTAPAAAEPPPLARRPWPREGHGAPRLLLPRLALRCELRGPHPPQRLPERPARLDRRREPGLGIARPLLTVRDRGCLDAQPGPPGQHPPAPLPRDRHRPGERRAAER